MGVGIEDPGLDDMLAEDLRVVVLQHDQVLMELRNAGAGNQ